MKVWVIGWPRSGTTWICRCLARCLGLAEGFDTPDNVVVRAHRRARKAKAEGDYPIVLVARDPRDAIVSHHYMGLQYNDDYSLTIRQYIEDPFMDGGIWGLPPGGWANYYTEWLDSSLNYTLVLHERAMVDRIGEMTRLVKACGEKPDSARIKRAVAHFTDETRFVYDERIRGVKGVLPSGPAVQAGSSNWRKHLSEEENQLVLSYCGDVMKRLGIL